MIVLRQALLLLGGLSRRVLHRAERVHILCHLEAPGRSWRELDQQVSSLRSDSSFSSLRVDRRSKQHGGDLNAARVLLPGPKTSSGKTAVASGGGAARRDDPRLASSATDFLNRTRVHGIRGFAGDVSVRENAPR